MPSDTLSREAPRLIREQSSPVSPAPHVLVDARFDPRRRGGDRCRFELAANLIRRADPPCTFLAYPDGASMLPPGDYPVVPVRCRPSEHPRGDVFEHVSLPRIVRRIDADIYHGTFQVLPLVKTARATVLTVHDMAVFAHPQGYSRRFAAYMRKILMAGIRSADRIITVSDATQEEMLRYFPGIEDKIVTILNGVGTEFLDAADASPMAVAAARKRYGLANPYILFVGNLEPKKNLPRLIAAFKRLRATKAIPHDLAIVGMPLAKGPGSGISSEDRERDDIRFTGYVDDCDLPLLYRGASLAAYPSLYEGFGMPVLEAMAAGTPVLTSFVSSLPEVAGGAAMLVDPMNVDAIASGLLRALTQDLWRAEAVERGLARARGLTWARNADRTARLYRELYGRTAGDRAGGRPAVHPSIVWRSHSSR